MEKNKKKRIIMGLTVVFLSFFFTQLIPGIIPASLPKYHLNINQDNPDKNSDVLWTFDMNSSAFGGGAIDDIDNDGFMEIVFGTYMGDSHVYALNAENGTLLWKFYSGPGPVDASVKINDVNDDGFKEVIFAGSGSGYMEDGTYGAGIIHVLNGTNGEIVWEYNTGYCTDSPAVIVDIDNDDIKEVIYGAWKESDDLGYVHILNGITGILEQKIGGFDGYIQSGPNILDLDGNGQLDIVVASFLGDDKVYAINGSTFDTLWSFQAGDSMYHGGSFADIDEDGHLEIAIGSYDDHVYVLNAENGSIHWSYNVGSYILAPTSLADLNNDGTFEVIAATNDLHVISSDGTQELWTYPTGGLIWRGASIADIDGDDYLDVCFGSEDGIIRVLNGSSGNVIWSFDVEADYGDTYEIDHKPIIADFNTDGYLDIFIAGGYGVSPPDNNHGRAYAFSIGNGTEAGWMMFRHDFRNSGCFNTVLGNPPYQPNLPTGPSRGNTNVSYTYSTSTIDPDGEHLYYQWDWGDTLSPWYGPYDSGESCNRSHTWENQGVYAVKVRAKDQGNQISNWSNVLNVSIFNSYHINNLGLHWNFISIPFNQSIEKTDIFISYGNQNYSWSEAVSNSYISNVIVGWQRDTQSYTFTTMLQPGYGYWIYAYQSCEMRAENVSAVSDTFITIIEDDWNVIGLPDDDPINKIDILVNDTDWFTAVGNKWIGDVLFGWNRIDQYYEFSDTLLPGQAYWLYAYQQCMLKEQR